MGLNDTCRDSTYVIANLRVWREAYLSHLRSTFSQVERAILRRSFIFSPLLFDENRLQEMIRSSKNNANITLHKAAIKILSRPHPAPGTPLVEDGSRPSSATATRPLAAPPSKRPPIPNLPRDSQCRSSSSHYSRPSEQMGGRREQSFRK